MGFCWFLPKIQKTFWTSASNLFTFNGEKKPKKCLKLTQKRWKWVSSMGGFCSICTSGTFAAVLSIRCLMKQLFKKFFYFILFQGSHRWDSGSSHFLSWNQLWEHLHLVENEEAYFLANEQYSKSGADSCEKAPHYTHSSPSVSLWYKEVTAAS